jgi:hypothetical protein
MGTTTTKEQICECCNITCATRRKTARDPYYEHCKCCPLQYKNMAARAKRKEQFENAEKKLEEKKQNDIKRLNLMECDWDTSDDLCHIVTFYKDVSNNYFAYDARTTNFQKMAENGWLYLNRTPEGKEKKKNMVQEMVQAFLIKKKASLVQVNNKTYYFSNETNELYEDIEYSDQQLVTEFAPERHFKLVLGKKKQQFLKDYQAQQLEIITSKEEEKIEDEKEEKVEEEKVEEEKLEEEKVEEEKVEEEKVEEEKVEEEQEIKVQIKVKEKID